LFLELLLNKVVRELLEFRHLLLDLTYGSHPNSLFLVHEGRLRSISGTEGTISGTTQKLITSAGIPGCAASAS
jgi:hypothetical protein